MDLLSERARIFARQIRYYWTFLAFVLVFVLVLWTFQLALIVRFQTFWPTGGSFCFSSKDETEVALEKIIETIKSTPSFASDSPFKVVCYYVVESNSSSHQRETLSINPFLCTHLNVGFAKVFNGSLIPRHQQDYKVYTYLMNLRIINPELKLLISAQEFSSPTGEFPKVISTDEMRKKFSKSAVQFLEKYAFDGLDIDWEFPSWPTSDPVQKQNFTLLLKELHSAFDKAKYQPLLSVAVGAPAAIFLQSYEISEMAKYVDWVNLMSYDYHVYSKLTPTTGPNAPLYQRPEDTSFIATLNTNWSVAHWEFWGMPKYKIIVGVPTYGHSFKLLNSDNTGWYAPAAGVGSLGEDGFTNYPEACKFLMQDGITQVWDAHYRVPYAFLGSEWISYESLSSIKHKADMVVRGGYGGVMVFSLNADDEKGVCHQGSYPLTSVVHVILKSAPAFGLFVAYR